VSYWDLALSTQTRLAGLCFSLSASAPTGTDAGGRRAAGHSGEAGEETLPQRGGFTGAESERIKKKGFHFKGNKRSHPPKN